ncbi:MAG: hypothetical protein ACRC1Z_06995 [Waterburya sp.]
MNLTSIEKIDKGWKIQYESKATDGIPVTVKYPSFNDIGLGSPTRDFLQAVAPFLRFAIAISHLDKDYWMLHGTVTAIKLKEGKDDQMLQVKVEADDKESFAHAKITTHWMEFSSLMSILQANYPEAESVNLSVDELTEQVEKYVNGDRAVEQLQLAIA